MNKKEPFIHVSALSNSSVDIMVRAEVKQTDYWDMLYQYYESVKVRFDAERIHIPFPQREVHFLDKTGTEDEKSLKSTVKNGIKVSN